MDIDYFKHVNDRYGHIIGSKVLVEMGQLLLKSLRSVDIVARYGGDEFVIVLPQTLPASAVQIAERMRKAVEQNSFLKKEGYALKLTASFGVASYPESAKSKEDLIRLADDAMYRVKYQTRNAVYAIV
jgi:diguanylate cyclase (GGDEF)-like protein